MAGPDTAGPTTMTGSSAGASAIDLGPRARWGQSTSRHGCTETGASMPGSARITREHGDVEFWLERIHAERSKAVFVGAGAMALTTQPPEEACELRNGP
jgi:hypothetical protein